MFAIYVVCSHDPHRPIFFEKIPSGGNTNGNHRNGRVQVSQGWAGLDGMEAGRIRTEGLRGEGMGSRADWAWEG